MPEVKEKPLGKNKALVEECLQTLIQSPYFRTMSHDLLRSVLRQGVLYEVPQGTYIIREGTVDEDLYFLLDGSLAVSSDGKLIITLSTPGSIIGEFALTTSAPRSADVAAQSHSRLVRISANVVKNSTQKPVQAAQLLSVFAHIMTAKLQETSLRAKLYEDAMQKVQEMASSNVRLEGEVEDKLKEVLLYSKVIESSETPVVITDPNGVVQRYNPAAGMLFIQFTSKIANQNIQDLLKSFDLGNFTGLAYGKPWHGEWACQTHENPMIFQVTVSPIKSLGGELLAVSIQMADITVQRAQEHSIALKNEEIRKALMDLESTFQELQRSDRLKMESLTVIGDELASPIRKILNHSTKLLQMSEDLHNHEMGRHVDSIVEQGRYLKAISENINHLIDLQVNLQSLESAPVNLNELISQVLKDMEGPAARMGIRLESHFPDISLSLLGDSERFKVMFNLLLEQALGVSAPDSVIRIQGVKLDKTQQIHLEITYKGPNLANITAEMGVGGKMGLLIGLPMARKVISQYQGSLQFLRDHQTTRISILLPCTQKEGEERPNRILILDEQDMDRLIVRGVIEHLWPTSVILETSEPFEFLENYEDFRPDLVVMDPHLAEPGWNNHRIVASLVQDRRHACPILAISGLYDDYAERTIAVERGVSDFLVKPYSIFDLRFKVSSLIQSQRQQESLTQNMDQAQRQAFTDGLTKLANRKHFDGFLETQINYSRQTKKPCSLIMLDIDNFKHYNDTNGHQLGDEVLKGVAHVLANSVRASDLAARYGGEEFVVVLPETQKEMAVVIAEKMRRSLLEAPFPHAERQPLGFVSASFGVSTFGEDAETAEGLIKAADQCMYIAKENGRNNVVKAPGLFKDAARKTAGRASRIAKVKTLPEDISPGGKAYK
ncbi:MAG: diguanylate cyclase [Deltaproteobacteria bacterium]|nr:diguanylate cyclase [Deltaproteobacteria bacterium]